MVKADQRELTLLRLGVQAEKRPWTYVRAHEPHFMADCMDGLYIKTVERLLDREVLSWQGDCRTYSYVAALSSDKDPTWKHLDALAKIIPRICHNVNRWGRPLESAAGL